MKKLMEILNLEVSFQVSRGEVKAVQGVSLDMYEGEVVALVGESGCGKSVTAKAMMRLISEKNGKVGEKSKILYRGENILLYDKKRWADYCGKECGMIFQDSMAALNPTITIGNQIAENIMLHHNISKSEAKNKAVQALQMVGIAQPDIRAKQYPHEFSGGMRQRGMIAMAMVCQPKVLIADEPTTALDVTIQAQILELMKSLKEKNKMSLLLITHDLGVVAGIADKIAVMYAGEIVEIGDVSSIYYDRKHPYTYSLLKAVPRLNIRNRKMLTAIEGMPPDLMETTKGCSFAQRCQYCMHICMQEKPPLYKFEEGHFAACWLHDKDADTSHCEFETGNGSLCHLD